MGLILPRGLAPAKGTGRVPRRPGRDWFPLRSNQLSVVRWRGRLLGPVPPSQSSGCPGPVVYVFDVFWLLSFGSYVPAPARLAPPFLRGLRCRKCPSGAPSSLISSGNFPPLALGRQASVGHSSASSASSQKTTVSLDVAGLGLAGSVDAGRSAWRVTRKNNCPLRCVSPDLSALGGAAGVDLSHDGGLIRSLPSPCGCGSSQYCLEVTLPRSVPVVMRPVLPVRKEGGWPR